MEPKCPSKAQRLSTDIISTLPQSITETILCLIPVEEAARTSILSRDWRYKCTTIPKLVFSESTVSKRPSEAKETSDKTSAYNFMDWRSKLICAIHHVLFQRQGLIQEFTLSMKADHHSNEIDQIILYLSMFHTIKKLVLGLCPQDYYKLPLSAFSFHQLTDLDLEYIDLDHQPEFFSGFPCLKSLYLFGVIISTEALLHLLSNCPSLTSLELSAELGPDKDCTIIELFECLPVIEHLTTIVTPIILWLDVGAVPKELPSSLINLKSFYLQEIMLADDDLRFLAVLIRFSPNLEKFRLDLEYNGFDEILINAGILEEFSDVWLEHLKQVEIYCYHNWKSQMEFVKFILARSPKLKKVCISCNQEHLEMLKTLPRPLHASPLEIVVL